MRLSSILCVLQFFWLNYFLFFSIRIHSHHLQSTPPIHKVNQAKPTSHCFQTTRNHVHVTPHKWLCYSSNTLNTPPQPPIIILKYHSLDLPLHPPFKSLSQTIVSNSLTPVHKLTFLASQCYKFIQTKSKPALSTGIPSFFFPLFLNDYLRGMLSKKWNTLQHNWSCNIISRWINTCSTLKRFFLLSLRRVHTQYKNCTEETKSNLFSACILHSASGTWCI